MRVEINKMLKRLCEKNDTNMYIAQFNWTNENEAKNDMREYFEDKIVVGDYFKKNSDYPENKDKNNMYILDTNKYIITLTDAFKDQFEQAYELTKEELEQVYSKVENQKLITFSLEENNRIVEELKNKSGLNNFDNKLYFSCISEELLTKYKNEGWNVQYVQETINVKQIKGLVEIYALIVK